MDGSEFAGHGRGSSVIVHDLDIDNTAVAIDDKRQTQPNTTLDETVGHYSSSPGSSCR